MMKKIMTLLLAFFMILGLAAPVVAEEESMDVSGSKKTSPTLLQSSERETTVTLSLPSAEYQNKIDIVFTMDSSSSAKNSAVFQDSVNELFDSILQNNPNVELKVGVVRFRGRAHDAINYLSDGAYSGLTVYSDETKSYIENALNMSEDDIKAAFGNGSNTHGGMDIADEWLAADTEVEDDHKYVVLLTDGKTYIWNNEANEPTCMYMQQYNNGGAGRWTIVGGGVPQFGQSISTYKSSYPVDVLDLSGKSNIFWFDDYQDLYGSTNEELSGTSPWDAACYYADTKTALPAGSVTKHDVTNGAALFGSNSATYGNRGDFQYYWDYTPNADWEGVPYLEANPFAVVENEDGTYTFDTETINPNYYMYHADGLQKSMYLSGHLWTEMNKKYNCAVITYGGGGATGFVALRSSFISWLQSNSKYGADITASAQVEALFEGIDNDIRYMVGSGVVTDKISEYFDMKEPADFRMTLNGEDLAGTKDGDKWVFGTADDEGKYPYELEYNAETKTITWTLNVPIENTKPVTLSYDLLLKDEYAIDGTKYPTNESAVLHYVSSDGKYEGDYTFEKPEVEYAVTSVEGTKTWDDDDNRDGKRPEEIRVVLLDEKGTEVGKTLVTAENGWKYEFTNLYKYEDGEEKVYTVKEFEVPEGYEATYDGYNIKNTHAPETIEITGTKIWDDDEDRDGLRPEEIRVVLLDENGTEYGKTLVTAENGWKYEFKGLFKYENGKEKVYTVKEFEVPEGYEATYEGYNVTNTHAPETTTVTVEKKWEDDNDAEGIRPEAVTVALLADGKEVMTAELNEKNGWKYTFESTEETQLYKYKEQGKEVEYTVEEKEVPEGYVSEVDGYTITNYLYVEPGEFEIVKIWKDEDNKNNTRPESITVHLFADGVEIGEFEITAEEDWKLGIAGVTKIVGTREVKFTVTEDPVKGYSTSIDGLTITNTLNPPTGVKGTTSFWMMAVCAAAAGILILRKKEEE
ncbi:MAG: Cna B-type domain-containing protein [Erysipelotrichales bacterium]|nr:Cna B-type domain-containing protein [Erysipelotrichales bacterium]